jgi:hypothetical protein
LFKLRLRFLSPLMEVVMEGFLEVEGAELQELLR